MRSSTACSLKRKCAKHELKTYLDHIVAECLSCDSAQACLLTKALNEVAEQDVEIRDIINQYLQSWQQALTQQFTSAAEQDC